MFFSLGLLLLLAYLYLDVTVRDSYSGRWTCDSSAAARAQGLLLQEYVLTPRTLLFENYRAEFTDCWVEEQTRTEHHFIFFKQVIKTGEPRFVLAYQGQRLAPDPKGASEAMVVRGHEGAGQDLAASSYDARPYQLAQHQLTDISLSDSVGNDTIYFSIMRGWQDKRRFQLKAYPREGKN